ncbi:MAG: hypothetical protein HXY25_12565 [Alphaproteobacteria bacterium]|nr:hypothetical protein [Alphaproteobacteria bacterium]
MRTSHYLVAAVTGACLLAAPQAGAQTVQGAVSLADLRSVMEEGSFSVLAQTSPDGFPYLIGLAPESAFAIGAAGFGCDGQTGTNCEGFVFGFVAEPSSANFREAFNAAQPYVKLYPFEGTESLVIESLAIGGITREHIGFNLFVLLDQLAGYVKARSTAGVSASLTHAVPPDTSAPSLVSLIGGRIEEADAGLVQPDHAAIGRALRALDR